MERLIKAGKVKAKMSKDVEKSIIGLGFELLDVMYSTPKSPISL